MQDKRKNQHGIALILVLGILAVLATLATTFAFNARLEQKAARNYLDAVTVDSIARIGVEYAIALLRNDITESGLPSKGYDWNGDTWGYRDDSTGPPYETRFFAYGGTHYVDLDDYVRTESDVGYGGTDAQWIGVRQGGVLVGRYAVLVIDEASKMNINTAGNIASGGSHGDNEGWTTAEIDLESLSDFGGLGADIVKYRYGANDQPGDTGVASSDKDDDEYVDGVLFILRTDGIDNDGDGGAPDEVGEGENEPDEYTPWYPRDDDEAFSTIRQIRLEPTITSTIWGNVKNLITVHSRTRNQYWDGSSWEDKKNINAVARINELYTTLDYDGIGIANLAQKICNIMDYRDENFIISSITKSGTTFYGVEPILINEVLGKSYKDDTSYTGTEDGTSSSVVYTGLAPNTCYRVTIDTSIYDPTPGEYTVKIGSTTEPVNADPYDFTSLSDCISDANGQLSITFEDTNLDLAVSTVTNVYFTCAEFIELYNASADDIDISNWTIDPGDGNFDTISAAEHYDGAPNQTTSVIPAGEYLVITNDEQLFAYSYGDKTNILGDWGDDTNETRLVAIIGAWSDGYADNPGELAEVGNVDILLKNADGLITDRACSYTGRYGDSTKIGVSREKDDPTFRKSDGTNWSGTALIQATALYDNDCCTGTLSNLYIKNHPFASIGEMADDTSGKYKGVASGTAWLAISGDDASDDLGKFAERITVDAVRLDAETASGTDADGTAGEWDASAAFPAAYSHYPTECCVSSSGSSETSYWAWTSARLQPVPHILYIYGVYTNDSDDDYLDVRIWNYSYATPDWDTIVVGNDLEYQSSDGLKFPVAISTGNISSNGSFKIELETDGSQTHDVYFDYLLLVPESTPGKLNLNTAWVDVLNGLPGIAAAGVAQAIYDNAHDGSPYTKLGDVLGTAGVDAAEFAPISNLVSVHSDCFQIICLAQAIKDMGTSHAVDDTDDLILAEKKVRVIVDRSSLDNLTSGAIKVLYWEEMRD